MERKNRTKHLNSRDWRVKLQNTADVRFRHAGSNWVECLSIVTVGVLEIALDILMEILVVGASVSVAVLTVGLRVDRTVLVEVTNAWSRRETHVVCSGASLMDSG